MKKTSRIFPYQRAILLTEGLTDPYFARTAWFLLKYQTTRIVAVLDKMRAGTTLQTAMGIHAEIPIFSSFSDILPYQPDCLIVGIDLTGGILPDSYRHILMEAHHQGLAIINNQHTLFSDLVGDDFITEENSDKWMDIREWDGTSQIATHQAAQLTTSTIMTVGTDHRVGKLLTAHEGYNLALQRDIPSKFLATDTTGILLNGTGFSLDRVPGDFLSGRVEKEVQDLAKSQPELIWVQGQGALLHPGASPLTLALLHGACPHWLILCHDPTLACIDQNPELPMLHMKEWMTLYQLMTVVYQPQVQWAGISLNTSRLDTHTAESLIAQLSSQLNLPVTDPIRFGMDPILNRICGL